MNSQPSLDPERPSRSNRLFAAAVLLVGVAALVVLAIDHPGEIRWMPPCPSAAYAGVTCPGCGSLRATHFLLNGEFAGAWRHNPAMCLLGVPALALLLFQCGRIAIGRRPLSFRWAPAWLGWGLLVLVLLWFGARNIPAWDWLRPPGS